MPPLTQWPKPPADTLSDFIGYRAVQTNEWSTPLKAICSRVPQVVRGCVKLVGFIGFCLRVSSIYFTTATTHDMKM